MLVITRKAGERICLGDEITITVMEISGSSVRIGIDAPADVPIYRHEIWEAIKEENRAAAQTDVTRLPTPRDRSQNTSSS
jgi:carbon storage regulator